MGALFGGSGFSGLGFVFRDWGLGFGVWGLGFSGLVQVPAAQA